MPNIITPTPEQWDAYVKEQSRAHVLQLSGWGALKAAYGWRTACIGVEQNDALVGGAQLLFRPLPFRLGTMAYLPMGPYIEAAYEEIVWQAIDQTAKQHGAAFLKWEPGIYIYKENKPHYGNLGFRPSPQTVQPPRTIMLDISDDDDAILARMNQGTRRKIRQSLKKGVRYWEAAPDEITRFTKLMQMTGKRNAFGVHEASYYALAYELFVPDYAALIMAEHEGDDLAGIMVFAIGDTAWYLYGASSNVKRNLMAAYGVQWQAIQWAKARGCRYYDMWGVPNYAYEELEAQFQSRSDGLWGVYGFKRGWGGDVVRSEGAWDKVYNPIIYTAYKTALWVRQRRAT